jgi:hypothetical protein
VNAATRASHVGKRRTIQTPAPAARAPGPSAGLLLKTTMATIRPIHAGIPARSRRATVMMASPTMTPASMPLQPRGRAVRPPRWTCKGCDEQRQRASASLSPSLARPASVGRAAPCRGGCRTNPLPSAVSRPACRRRFRHGSELPHLRPRPTPAATAGSARSATMNSGGIHRALSAVRRLSLPRTKPYFGRVDWSALSRVFGARSTSRVDQRRERSLAWSDGDHRDRDRRSGPAGAWPARVAGWAGPRRAGTEAGAVLMSGR